MLAQAQLQFVSPNLRHVDSKIYYLNKDEIKNEIDFEFIESKKEITLPYEENLYRQCISLYQKLK